MPAGSAARQPAILILFVWRTELDSARVAFSIFFKRAPLVLLCLLLGPFVPGFLLIGKRARRDPGFPAARNLALLTAFTVAYCSALFLLPVPNLLLLLFHFGFSLFSGIHFARRDPQGFLQGASQSSVSGQMTAKPKAPFSHSLLSIALAVYPPFYFWGLLRMLGEMKSFSIHLPSAVFTESLFWSLWATPIVLLGSVWVHTKNFRFGLRQLLFFYAAFPILLVWIVLWEKIDQGVLEFLGAASREPLFFDFAPELSFRKGLQIAFYGSGALMGIAYLVRAPGTGVFLRRAMSLGLPILLVYLNLMFYSGHWNRYLAGMGTLLGEQRAYGLRDAALSLQLKRTPGAYLAPEWEKNLLERVYQSGRVDLAEKRLEKWVARSGRREYHGRHHFEAVSMQENWQAHNHGNLADTALLLDVPAIQPANYLNTDWYGLLSAIAYLNPGEDDLRIKTRLLDISTTLHISLPDISTLPALSPVLRQLGVPSTAAFLNGELLRQALGKGLIPYLYRHGHWVALCGYDPVRKGYYYLDYDSRRAKPRVLWGDRDDLFAPAKDTENSSRASQRSVDAGESGLRRFILAQELENHLHDIGGVGVILGDSAFVSEEENRSAFLVELGDLRYQQYGDYAKAAEDYRQAYALFPSEYVAARMVYLRNLHMQKKGDPRSYLSLFEAPGIPAWFHDLQLDSDTEANVKRKIRTGALGRFLLMGWSSQSSGPATYAQRRFQDSLQLDVYRVLHELDPYESDFVDSLAGLHMRMGNWETAVPLLRRSIGMKPGIHSHSHYRLAWTLFKSGNMEELPHALAKSQGFENEPRYLTMQGALALWKGKPRAARPWLEKSLKLNKGMPETHAMMAEIARSRNDSAAASLHERWLERSGRTSR